MVIGTLLVFVPIAMLAAAASVGQASQFDAQVILGFVVPKVIQWIKESQWLPFRWVATPTTAKFVSGLVAGLLALGIIVSFEGDIWSSAGATVIISNVSLPTVVNAAAAFLFQWILQHTSYAMFWKKQPA